MARLLAYMSNDNTLSDCLMQEVCDEVQDLSQDLGAVGMVWLQDEQTLERKYPRAPVGLDLFESIGALRSRTQLIKIQSDTQAPLQMPNLEPFKFKKWLYAQGEPTPTLGVFREDMEAQLPEFLRSYMRGTSMAEVLFYHALHRLFDYDVFHNAVHRTHEAAYALGELVLSLEALLHRPLQQHHTMLSTNRVVLGVSIGAPTYCKIWNGIEEPPAQKIGGGFRPKPKVHPYFKGALFVSGVEPCGEGWVSIPDRHVYWLSQDWTLHGHAIE